MKRQSDSHIDLTVLAGTSLPIKHRNRSHRRKGLASFRLRKHLPRWSRMELQPVVAIPAGSRRERVA